MRNVKITSLLRLIFPALILGLLAACGGGNEGPENVYIADNADNGETVTMAVGDVLQLMLEENPTTGYVWNIVTNDTAVLRESEEPAYEVESDAIGAGGTKTYLFEAVGTGTSVLRLINSRSQDSAVDPAEVFELTIQVVP